MPFVTGKRSTEHKYVYELPYTERKCLCNILDINDQWEKLGGEKMGFSVIELSEMKRAEKCGDSPTDRLLQHWGRKNNTIVNLYFLLYSMEHFQAMNILLPFVPKEYHYEKLHEDFSLTFDPKLKTEKSSVASQLPKPDLSLLQDLRTKSETRLNSSSSRTRQGSKTDSLIPPSRPTTTLQDNHNFCRVSSAGESQPKVPRHLLTSKEMKEVPQASRNHAAGVGIGLASEKIINTASPSEDESFSSKEDNIEANNHQAANETIKKFSPKVEIKEETAQAPPSRKRNQSNCSDASNFSDCGVPMIPYRELEEATSSWNRNHLLGSGGFGSVFKGTWINVNVAIKKINQSQKESPGSSSLHISQVMDELRFLQKYRHDNILQVYGFSADPDKPHCLVYQFMSNGSLEYRLQCKKIDAVSEGIPFPLNWRQRFTIAKGTAAALQFLHTVQEKPLIHGDVKSANILLDGYLQPKLGDFGLAREGPHSEYTSMKVSHVHGTRPYIPEEYLRSKKLSTKVDTYSFGIVLFEICSGRRAYSDRTKKYLKDEVHETPDRRALRDPKAGSDYPMIFEELFDIGLNCIRREPKRRPDMTTVFQDLESISKILKEEQEEQERQRKMSMEEYPNAISSNTPPITYTSISTSPSIYPSHMSAYPPHPAGHSYHPAFHPSRMMNPHIPFSPSPHHPPYRHHVVPLSPVLHHMSGIPPGSGMPGMSGMPPGSVHKGWMRVSPLPPQESAQVLLPTFIAESDRSSQGFCPPRPHQVMKERIPDLTLPPYNPIPDRTPSYPPTPAQTPYPPTPAQDPSYPPTPDPTPSYPPIPDISLLRLKPSSKEPISYSSVSSSSSSSSSESSSDHESESIDSVSNEQATPPKDSKMDSEKVTEVCIPLLSQLGTAPRSSRDGTSRGVRPKTKAVSAQGKSTFLD